MKMTQVESIKVDEDTALELMVYHLQCAHHMFQNVAEGDEARDETVRLFQKQYLAETWKDDGGLGRMELHPYWTDAPEIEAGLQ